jgi:hypothetical protein
LNDKIVEAYSAISHLELHAAKWRYIKAWQALPSYGISYFAVRINNSRQKKEILGIASSRLLRVSAEGEVLRTWRFSAMKCWSVNWESRQLAVAFERLDRDGAAWARVALRALRAAHEEGVNDRLCIVCCDAPACVVLLPCGHSQLCSKCADALAAKAPFSCPTCRKVVTQKQRTFF